MLIGKSVMKSYVYEGTEVVLTGRTAERKTYSPVPQRRNKTRAVDKVEVLYEITPADKSSIIWKQWVSIGSLYEVKDNMSGVELLQEGN